MSSRAEPVGSSEPAETAALAAIDAGDYKVALTRLMQAYGVELYRYCRQMVGNDGLADDVHQTVFVQAYEDLRNFSRRSSLRAWLYGIARHRCLDALKMGQRWGKRFTFTQPADVVDETPLADERLKSRALSRVLERCLQKLAPHIRMAVLLRYQEGISYEEMADICRERPATLQARVARALPALRSCVANADEAP